jgi:hypothetical protein
MNFAKKDDGCHCGANRGAGVFEAPAVRPCPPFGSALAKLSALAFNATTRPAIRNIRRRQPKALVAVADCGFPVLQNGNEFHRMAIVIGL